MKRKTKTRKTAARAAPAASHGHKPSGKWKLILAAIFIVALAGAVMLSKDRSEEATLQLPEKQTEQQAQAAPETAPAAPAPAQPARVKMNEDVLYEDLSFTEFPTVKEVQLESGMKYSVSFETDNPIQFILYSEERYNSWVSTGQHSTSKANTNNGVDCCSKNFVRSIDINTGEGGKYFLVFDDSKLGTYDQRPTIGHVRVTKTSTI